jgi:hypothetical protein
VASKLLGVPELQKTFDELGGMTRSEWRSTMRKAVRTPMSKVQSRAQGNIAKISPGRTLLHRTYRGRLVSAGFAARNLRLIVKFSRGGGSATAILGVRAEAFYALAFFERGTSEIAAQPWLVPAFRESRETAVNDVGQAWLTRINAIAKKRLAASPKAAAA